MAINYFDQKSVAGMPAFENAAGDLLGLMTRGFISLDKNAAGETVFKTPDARVQNLMNDIYAFQLSADGKLLSRSLNTVFGGPATYSITESSNGPILNSKFDNELGTGNFSTPLLNVSDIKTSGGDQVSYLSQFGKYAQGAEARKEYKDGGLLGDLQNLVTSMGPLAPIAIAFALPGAGAYLGSQLFAAEIAAGTMTTAYATTIGSGILSTAVQTANGIPLETALKNSAVNAITQTGAESAATDLKKYVGKFGADAIASAGGSIASTLAKGGSADDAIKNAGAAIVASGVSSETDRAVGAAVGGAITGGATGAALGALGELGKPTPTDKGTQLASAGDITKDPGVVSDSPVTEIPPIEITAPQDNVQVVSPTQTQKPAPSRDQKIIDLISPPVTELSPIEVTAPKSNVQTVSPDASVTSKEETPKDTSTTKEDPNLFIYSSKSPLSQALKLGMGTGVSSSAGTAGTTPGSEALGQALKTDAGDPLFGGKKKGKKSGWNVESLRYMGQES